jgi:hypothetical protein
VINNAYHIFELISVSRSLSFYNVKDKKNCLQSLLNKFRVVKAVFGSLSLSNI